MAATVNCVVCGSKVISGIYTGHVHKGDETVIARFCSRECCDTPWTLDCEGCRGEWKPEHGYDKSFGELCYIDSDGLHPIDPDE